MQLGYNPSSESSDEASTHMTESQDVERSYTFFIAPGNNADLVRTILAQRSWWTEVKLDKEQWSHMASAGLPQGQPVPDFIWTPTLSKVKVASLPGGILVNKFLSNRVLCTKSGLVRCLASYLRPQGRDLFDFVPRTYIILGGTNGGGYSEFARYFRTLCFQRARKTISQGHTTSQNIWIVKPIGLNRGRGIGIYSKVEDITAHVNKNGSWVVQRYITDPMLVHGRKFDIRVYVLVTDDFKVYMYREGYLRTSSEPYTSSEFTNLGKHLTNNAIQKKSDKYGLHELGNMLSYEAFNGYLSAQYPESGWSAEGFHRTFMELSKLTCLSAQQSLQTSSNSSSSNSCPRFELFGFDYMMDSSGKVWLLEVNTNPCLELASPCVKKLLPGLLDDTFRIVLDPIFPGPDDVKTTVAEPPENGFVLLHSPQQDASSKHHKR